ncbi:MAG: hypothetical protein II419_01930, partial [Acidaminococcaceae bacterium]|nr:hypothetical protein [Acidaminococcaceae bacterium]
ADRDSQPLGYLLIHSCSYIGFRGFAFSRTTKFRKEKREFIDILEESSLTREIPALAGISRERKKKYE